MPTPRIALFAVAGCALFAIACATTHDDARAGGASGGAQLDNASIDVGMERVRGMAAACVAQGHGGTDWIVRLTIRPDGHPTEVHVDSTETPDPMVSSCLEGVIASAVFPPFSGPPMSVTYPYTVLR